MPEQGCQEPPRARWNPRVYPGWSHLALLASGLLLSSGCLRPAPPQLDLEQLRPPAEKLDLSAYIRAARFGEWVYERRELPLREESEPSRVVRRVTAERYSEGNLVGRGLPPLERYLQKPPPEGDSETAEDIPREPPPHLSSRENPYLLELVEPMEPVPLELAKHNPLMSASELRYYGRRGRLEMTGTLTRRVELEGVQDVDCPAGHFVNCLRIKLEMHIEFPFGPSIDWNSYSWLSAEAGEVRRIEEFSGLFWIFGFGSAHEFRLVSYNLQAVETRPVELSPRWARGLITLDRGIPRPRISGLIFDFENEPASRPTAASVVVVGSRIAD